MNDPWTTIQTLLINVSSIIFTWAHATGHRLQAAWPDMTHQTRHLDLSCVCLTLYKSCVCVFVCLIMCVKQPPHHDSARYMHMPSSGSPAWHYWEGKGPWWEAISVHWNNTQANYSLNLTTGYTASSHSHCSQNGRVAIKHPHTRQDSSWITMRSRTQSGWQSLKQWGREGSLYMTPSFVFSVPGTWTPIINGARRYWLSVKVKRLGSVLHLILWH